MQMKQVVLAESGRFVVSQVLGCDPEDALLADIEEQLCDKFCHRESMAASVQMDGVDFEIHFELRDWALLENKGEFI
jgi:hypothetical protein